MKGDLYQPRASIRAVLVGSLVIGPEGRIAETDEEAAALDGYPSLVRIPADSAAAPTEAPVAKKPRAPRRRKAAVA